MLSNINADKHQLLQIILVGQPQLKELLIHPDLEQFAQRVEVDFHIKPLASEEVREYIHYRLKVAGREIPLFTDEACEKIFEASKGVPRKINILCNMSLVYGFGEGDSEITKELVEEVIADKNEFGALSTFEEKDLNQVNKAKIAPPLKSPKQKYSADFKKHAISRVLGGQTVSAIAKEFDINEHELLNWIKTSKNEFRGRNRNRNVT